MRFRDRSTCSPEASGMPPFTRPVLPPWGTSAMPNSAESFTISLTSSTVSGSTMKAARPKFCRQKSCSNGAASVPLKTCLSPRRARAAVLNCLSADERSRMPRYPAIDLYLIRLARQSQSKSTQHCGALPASIIPCIQEYIDHHYSHSNKRAPVCRHKRRRIE